MGRTVKLSTKHQIVIPGEVRKQLGLSAGDRLLVEVHGKTIVLVPWPKDYARYARGLHKEVWEGVDAVAYVRNERKGWR